MKSVFIESFEFTEWVTEYLTDQGLAALQRDLLNHPDAGDVMPGCGGLRKLRIADPGRGKGKRGGGLGDRLAHTRDERLLFDHRL